MNWSTRCHPKKVLDLPASVVAALHVHRDWQRFERQAAGPRWLETGLVFVTPIGTPLDWHGGRRRTRWIGCSVRL
jgi:hypothetical protein